MPDYTWAVQLPGEDLPHRLTTDYLVSEGDEIEVDGSEWLVESVELEDEEELTGIVSVVPPR
jgi:hypothetical protein